MDTLSKEHFSNEDIVCSPNHIELCTNLPVYRDTSLHKADICISMVPSIQRFRIKLNYGPSNITFMDTATKQAVYGHGLRI